MKKATLSDNSLRNEIRTQLELTIVQEGLWDGLKDGVKKLSGWVTKQFASLAAGWAEEIGNKIGESSQAKQEATEIWNALQQGMKETGETFKLDKTLAAAKSLGQQGDGAIGVVDQDMSSGVKDKVEQENVKQEGKYLPSIYLALNEDISAPQKLTEDFGVSAALGVGLAVMGGLPLLFKGLGKLATALGATQTAEIMHKAEHVTHAFEQKTIDFVMPDALAYAVYKILQKNGLKITDNVLSNQDFKKSDALPKVKNLIYKAVLIYFAINGVVGAMKAGISLLGFVEGTATTVKGIELAKGASEVAKIIKAA